MNNNSYDSALEDFLLRFGDQNKERQKVTTANAMKSSGPAFQDSTVGTVDTSGLTFKQKSQGQSTFGNVMSNQNTYAGLATGAASAFVRLNSMGDDATNDEKEAAIMSGIKDGVASAIPIAGIFKQVEESGKEIGKLGGAETSGFVSGALDPLTTIQSDDTKGIKKVMAIDPLASAMISMQTAKRKAKKKNEDAREFNLKESALEREKREQDYRMEQGLASLENLKYLRQKQLGLTS